MNKIDLERLGTPAFTLEIGETGELRFTGLNSLHTKVTGVRFAEIVGRTPHECLPDDVASQVEAHYRRCVLSGAVEEYEEELELPLGRKWWRTTLTPVFDVSGRHAGILGTAVDITESKRRELELVDPVTRLPNSRRFALDVADAMGRASETGRPFSLVVVDILPGGVPASCTISDERRCFVGQRLRQAVRGTDKVARTGHDRFAALVSAATQGALAVVVDKVRRKLTTPLVLGETGFATAVGGAVWSAPMQMVDLVNSAVADLQAFLAASRRG